MVEEYEYTSLINPANLFDSVEEILDFISLSDDIMELQAFLNACIQEELYYYCIIIQDKIDKI